MIMGVQVGGPAELVGRLVVLPPFVKDARDWKAAGATKEVVLAVIKAANYARRNP